MERCLCFYSHPIPSELTNRSPRKEYHRTEEHQSRPNDSHRRVERVGVVNSAPNDQSSTFFKMDQKKNMSKILIIKGVEAF